MTMSQAEADRIARPVTGRHDGPCYRRPGGAGSVAVTSLRSVVSTVAQPQRLRGYWQQPEQALGPEQRGRDSRTGDPGYWKQPEQRALRGRVAPVTEACQ